MTETRHDTSAGADEKLRLHPAAYRELEKGEVFEPYVPARSTMPEFTTRSMVMGIIMVLVFAVASTYSGLKVAQVMEAAIPISILAVGVSGLYKRRNSILENVIIQSIGGASGLIVAGSIFTLPALYIMDVAPGTATMLLTIFIVSVLGASLGLLFLIPLRRYFVVEQHGKLPFPEATAINEVFVTGEKGGDQAATLVKAALIGGVYDFLAVTMKAWNEIVNFRFVPVVEDLATKFRATVSLNAVSLIVGLGYITGLRFSAIICAGGFFSALIMVPLIYHFGQHIPALAIPPAPLPGFPSFLPEMNANQVFRLYAQRIGVGTMAGAGIIGIIRALPTIVRAFSLGFQQIFHKHAGGDSTPRTDRDLKMSTVLGGIVMCAIAIGVFFYVLLSHGDPAVASKAPQIALTGLAIAFVFAFLFTTVAALATAMTGNNPISGMTLVTLIIGSSALVAVGLEGQFGKYAAIVMGAVVCTSLSMAGGFVTDLKVGYWLGATPRRQEISKVIGMLFAAVGVALTVLLIHKAYGHVDAATGKFISGFMNTAVVPAPQANLFATILGGIFDKAPVTWLLYSVGLVLSVLLVMMGIPPLAFAIGMYLPLQINTPLWIGGLISNWVEKSSKDKVVSEARVQRGTLLASGFIAGGALAGVLGAVLQLVKTGVPDPETPGQFLAIGQIIEFPRMLHFDPELPIAQILSIALFVGLCIFLYVDSKRAKV
jgi:putative OPT family oligopeptide transporter